MPRAAAPSAARPTVTMGADENETSRFIPRCNIYSATSIAPPPISCCGPGQHQSLIQKVRCTVGASERPPEILPISPFSRFSRAGCPCECGYPHYAQVVMNIFKYSLATTTHPIIMIHPHRWLSPSQSIWLCWRPIKGKSINLRTGRCTKRFKAG